MRFFYDILKKTTLTIALIAVAMVQPSCTDSEEPDAGSVQGNARVGFTITVSDTANPSQRESRAPSEPVGGYDPGNGYENFIDLASNDFRFYFFSAGDPDAAQNPGNRYLGRINIISIVPVESANGYKRYLVQGSLPRDLAGMTDFKVCVLANWKDYPDLNAGDNLSTLWQQADNNIYRFTDGRVDAANLIPLYGIKAYSDKKFEPDSYVQLDNIHLLRAYAKVEVNLDASVYPVESITVTRVNDSGFKAPQGIDEESEYVHNDYESDYANTPHIPAGVTVSEDVAMHPAPGNAATGPRRYTIYLPEYDNTPTNAATPTRLRVKYTDPLLPDSYIDFKYYQQTGSHAKNEPFDVLRNYYYRFNVSQKELDLTVYVDVQPYAEVILKPDLGLERDEEGYIIVRNNKGQVIKYIRTDGAELTLGNVEMPYYGTIRAVFDSKRRALLGYLNDGRRVYWNYDGESQTTAHVTSWEIYTAENDTTTDIHLDEDYILRPSSNSQIRAFTHTFYDDSCRVIRRFIYNSNEAFEARPNPDYNDGNIAGVRRQVVSFTGKKYGAKEISYKDETGKVYCKITVTADANGKETETYTYY